MTLSSAASSQAGAAPSPKRKSPMNFASVWLRQPDRRVKANLAERDWLSLFSSGHGGSSAQLRVLSGGGPKQGNGAAGGEPSSARTLRRKAVSSGPDAPSGLASTVYRPAQGWIFSLKKTLLIVCGSGTSTTPSQLASPQVNKLCANTVDDVAIETIKGSLRKGRKVENTTSPR